MTVATHSFAPHVLTDSGWMGTLVRCVRLPAPPVQDRLLTVRAARASITSQHQGPVLHRVLTEPIFLALLVSPATLPVRHVPTETPAICVSPAGTFQSKTLLQVYAVSGVHCTVRAVPTTLSVRFAMIPIIWMGRHAANVRHLASHALVLHFVIAVKVDIP